MTTKTPSHSYLTRSKGCPTYKSDEKAVFPRLENAIFIHRKNNIDSHDDIKKLTKTAHTPPIPPDKKLFSDDPAATKFLKMKA
jgi:hypothetical protein